MKAYKFKVESPEQSERLQKVLFELGYEWAHFGAVIQIIPPIKHLYVFDNSSMSWGEEDDTFENMNNKEKDTEEFIRRHSGGQAERGIKKHSKRAVKQDKWISVSEGGLPKNVDRCYLVYCAHNKCEYTAYLGGGGDRWYDWSSQSGSYLFQEVVTHWRKMPEGPKE